MKQRLNYGVWQNMWWIFCYKSQKKKGVKN